MRLLSVLRFSRTSTRLYQQAMPATKEVYARAWSAGNSLFGLALQVLLVRFVAVQCCGDNGKVEFEYGFV